MAFESMLSKMGSGMKHFTDRYVEYEAPIQDPQLLYPYSEHGVPTVEANPKLTYGGGGGGKNNAAMSALTLLAFLFFLHILQQCIKDHMVAMSTPQITIMTAGREGEEAIKTAKIDKAGITEEDKNIDATKENYDVENNDDENKHLMKIYTAKPPKIGAPNYAFANDYGDRRYTQTGFVNAMDEDFN